MTLGRVWRGVPDLLDYPDYGREGRECRDSRVGQKVEYRSGGEGRGIVEVG